MKHLFYILLLFMSSIAFGYDEIPDGEYEAIVIYKDKNNYLYPQCTQDNIE